MSCCNRVVVRGPGKINLSLDITGVTGDGYHSLDTVMQTVELSDIVILRRYPGKELQISCSRPGIPLDDTNIAHRAAMIFFTQLGIPAQGLSIHIDKLIPVQAGLAGGSADAAAVLRGMNRLFETGLTEEELRKMGEKVGADVPFCLAGGCKLARGKGEILSDLPGLPSCAIAVAKPREGVSTAQAFKLYDENPNGLNHPDTPSMLRAIKAGNLGEIGRNMVNVFEQLTDIGEVKMIKDILLRGGAAGAAMSGSGSAVVGLFAGKEAALACLSQQKELAEQAYLTFPSSKGTEIIHIG